MSSILVTGGSGFMGTALIEMLVAEGHEITVLDIVPPRAAGPVKYCEGSILDRDAVAAAMAGTEVVIHLASLVGVATTEGRDRATLDTVLTGTTNVLDAIDNQRFILASTSEIYGNATVVPTPEDHAPSPVSVYGAAKLAAEYYWKSHPNFAANGTILRFFSVYGPAQRPEFVVPKFVRHILAGEPAPLYGGGSQVRAFLHVQDAVRAIICAMGAAGAGQTFNIANSDEPVSMRELAGLISAVAGGPAATDNVDFADSDRTAQREIHARTGDPAKATKILGFKAKIDLNSGLKDVVTAQGGPR
jgi:nucleoside-diphosphate-sugar epimerase